MVPGSLGWSEPPPPPPPIPPHPKPTLAHVEQVIKTVNILRRRLRTEGTAHEGLNRGNDELHMV